MKVNYRKLLPFALGLLTLICCLISFVILDDLKIKKQLIVTVKQTTVLEAMHKQEQYKYTVSEPVTAKEKVKRKVAGVTADGKSVEVVIEDEVNVTKEVQVEKVGTRTVTFNVAVPGPRQITEEVREIKPSPQEQSIYTIIVVFLGLVAVCVIVLLAILVHAHLMDREIPAYSVDILKLLLPSMVAGLAAPSLFTLRPRPQ